MKVLNYLFYVLVLFAIAVTYMYGRTLESVGMLFFALSPYAMLLYLLHIAKDITAVVTARVVTVFIVSVGLYFLLDTTYMERLLSYKFSFLFIPLWQWTMLLVSGFVIYLSNAKAVDVFEQKEDV